MRVQRSEDWDTAHVLNRRIFAEEDGALDVRPDSRLWLAYDGDKAVGFGAIRPILGGHGHLLERAGVLWSARGHGLQRRLIQARCRGVKGEIITYTVADNPASMRSLIACGFRPYTPQYAWAGDGVVYWIRE